MFCKYFHSKFLYGNRFYLFKKSLFITKHLSQLIPSQFLNELHITRIKIWPLTNDII